MLLLGVCVAWFSGGVFFSWSSMVVSCVGVGRGDAVPGSPSVLGWIVFSGFPVLFLCLS